MLLRWPPLPHLTKQRREAIALEPRQQQRPQEEHHREDERQSGA